MSLEDRDQRDSLQSLIAEVLEAEGRGESFDREALILTNPDYADSLREFFVSHDQMKSAADVDSPTLPPRSTGPESEDPTIAPGARPTDDPTLSTTEGTSQQVEPTAGDQVRYFGDYELLEEIARGGMGVVFKARQINLNRIVALKMILSGEFAGEEDVKRFHTEAEAAAQLDHPGIVPIFEIGEHQGQHYFSMGFVQGESLAQKVAAGPLPPREAAELVKKICDAMAYAHERGVIHRDLKPANILIDQNGQPKVTDFGLAKKTQADSNLTGTGQILGTPAYMPPEQASGQADVGPLADVYSLGAILYCLLTGRPPFQAASPMDTLLQVLDKEPVSPRILNETIPKDLETICQKCLQKEVRARYSSGTELQDELKRFLHGEPIHARPVGRLERGWRWCQRNKALSTASAAALMLLLTISVVAPIVAFEQAKLRSDAEQLSGKERQAREDAESQRDLLQRSAYNTQLNRAHSIIESEPQKALRLLNDTALCPESLQDMTYHLLKSECSRELGEIETAKGLISIAHSPDGQFLAAATGGGVEIWNLASRIRVRAIDFNQPGASASARVIAAAFSPDSKFLCATALGDAGATRVWEVATGKQVAFLRCTERNSGALCVDFSPDGQTIVLGTATRKGEQPVIQWNWRSSTLRGMPGLSGVCLTAKFSPDGKLLAAAGSSREVVLWNMEGETPVIIKRFTGHQNPIGAVRFSPDNRLLVSAGHRQGNRESTSEVRVWDLVRDNQLSEFNAGPFAYGFPAIPLIDFEFTDSTTIAVPIRDTAVALFDVRSGREVSRLNSPWVISVSYDAATETLAYASRMRGSVKFWETRQKLGQQINGTFSSPGTSANRERVTAYEVVAKEYVKKHWDFGTFANEATLAEDIGHNTYLSRNELAAVEDGALVIRNLDTKERTILAEKMSGRTEGLITSNDGKYLVVLQASIGGESHEAQVWDLREHQLRFRFPYTASLGASVYGDRIVTYDSDTSGKGTLTSSMGSYRPPQSARVWSLDSGQQIGTVPANPQDSDAFFSLSQDGTRFAAAYPSSGYSIFETRSMNRIVNDADLDLDHVDYYLFSPNLDRLLVVDRGVHEGRNRDRPASVFVREIASKTTIHLEGVPQILHTARFTPDGKTVVTTGCNRAMPSEIAFWDPITGQQRYSWQDNAGIMRKIMILFSDDSKGMVTWHQIQGNDQKYLCYTWSFTPVSQRRLKAAGNEVEDVTTPQVVSVDSSDQAEVALNLDRLWTTTEPTRRPSPFDAKRSKLFAGGEAPATTSSEMIVAEKALTRIGLAIRNYRSAYKRLPPQYGPGQSQKLSWRVHVLPLLQDKDAESLYREFKLDEPWNSEHNSKLINRIPTVFAAASEQLTREGKTRIVFPFHPKAVYHDRLHGVSIRMLPNDLGSTILAVVADEAKAVVWTKPDDYDIDLEDPRKGWSQGINGIPLALVADGSIAHLPKETDNAEIRTAFLLDRIERTNRSVRTDVESERLR